MVPRLFNIDVLEAIEFKQGPAILVVVEKEKAVSDIQETVGKLEIKSKADIEKYKKKTQSASSTSSMMFNYGNNDQ